MHTIHDKHGNEYRLVEGGSEDFKRWNVEYRGTRVAYINFHFAGPNVLHIDDLCISENVIFVPWFWFGSLSFPPLRWRTKNFRNRGIGTAMIESFVNFARSHSVKRIEGEIKPHDSKENQDLPNWYQRRGFTVAVDGKIAWDAKKWPTV